MARRPLYDKAHQRTVKDTITERDMRYGRVHSFAGTATSLTIEWDLNEAATEDRVCKITIGKETAYVDAEQMQKFLRWV